MEELADRIRARLKFVAHPVEYRLLLEAEAALRARGPVEAGDSAVEVSGVEVAQWLEGRGIKLLPWQRAKVLGEEER